MKTKSNSKAAKKSGAVIEKEGFKTGNVSSLARRLVKSMGSEKAWAIAKDAKAKFGNFSYDEAMSLVKHNNLAKAANSVHVSRKARTEPTLGKIRLKAGETKNGKIRELLAEGHGLTAIANSLDLGYQRVKNVKRSQDRKSTSKK